MSTHIKGFIPDVDTEYQRHKKVLLACLEAEVDLPKQTAKYFNSEFGYLRLLEEKLEVELIEGVHYLKYNGDMTAGFDVDLLALPKGVTKLRFYNSY